MGENKNKNKNTNAMGIASLTLGIISLCTGLFWYIAIPTGILAIIFGAKTIKATEKKTGKAGLIIGIIATALSLFMYVSMFIILLLSEIL